MPTRRPVARRSYARRRIRRITSKWSYVVIPRRFKLLMPVAAPELEFELTVLDYLEKKCFTALEALAIPTAMWEYYVGYAKRLWERRMSFSDETYLLERLSLRNEYIQRGLLSAGLDAIEDGVSEAYTYKVTKTAPPPPPMGPAWNYNNVMGPIWMFEPHLAMGGSYDNIIGNIWLLEPQYAQGGSYDNRQ